MLSGAFDVVLTDRAMPDMNGDQLAGSIKAASQNTAVILLTGFGDLMEPLGDKPDGVDLILGKPVRLQTPRDAIGRAGKLHR